MSEADKMFKKENYKINDTWGDNVITYTNTIKEPPYNIHFWKDSKTISKNGDVDSIKITMQELQAINKKVEEIGWNN